VVTIEFSYRFDPDRGIDAGELEEKIGESLPFLIGCVKLQHPQYSPLTPSPDSPISSPNPQPLTPNL
jgi:hypothetical protein